MRGRHTLFGRRSRRRTRARITILAVLTLAAATLLASEGFSRWPPATEAADASVLRGRARVIDGDTLEISGQRIRLWGVDAPEADQSCGRGRPGRDSAMALANAMGGRDLVCRARERDQYGRVVASCAANGQDVAERLVREGWAWDYRHYSRGRYRAAEAEARRAGRGVWALACVPPWEWRHRQS